MERLVVIGGDAAGMAAASNARRRRTSAELEIVALEKGRWTSYSACGIPYVLGGDVDGMQRLVVRSPQEFRDKYDIDARTGSEAVAIDVDAGRVEVRDTAGGATYGLGFDHLLVATGAVPRRPEVARTGLNATQAAEAGFTVETATVETTTRAGYLPGAEPLTVKVVVDRATARLLGAQIVGREGAAKRIDVFAAALAAGMTVDRLLNVDLSYAPPFGPVWDPVLIAARQAWAKVERV